MTTPQTVTEGPTSSCKDKATTRTKQTEPLLYQKRERIADNAYSGDTTSCQTTSNPTDFSPDD